MHGYHGLIKDRTAGTENLLKGIDLFNLQELDASWDFEMGVCDGEWGDCG